MSLQRYPRRHRRRLAPRRLKPLGQGDGRLEQDEIDPFWNETATDGSPSSYPSPCWQLLLGWTSEEPDIRNRTASNIKKIVSPPFKPGRRYLGFSPAGYSKPDYVGWPANQEIRASALL